MRQQFGRTRLRRSSKESAREPREENTNRQIKTSNEIRMQRVLLPRLTPASFTTSIHSTTRCSNDIPPSRRSAIERDLLDPLEQPRPKINPRTHLLYVRFPHYLSTPGQPTTARRKKRSIHSFTNQESIRRKSSTPQCITRALMLAGLGRRIAHLRVCRRRSTCPAVNRQMDPQEGSSHDLLYRRNARQGHDFRLEL